jgi:hypothetical protein
MNIQPPGKDQQNDHDCHKCTEKDYPTQKTIKAERQKICDTLYATSGTVKETEKKFHGEQKLYHEKKRMFGWTETNYKLYRNLEILVGTELLQTNDSVKTNVKNYLSLNKDLNTQLTNIANGIKSFRIRFRDLQDAAGKLKWCIKDSCNAPQMKALGIPTESCNEKTKELPRECSDAEKIFDELICNPNHLYSDLESIFKSSFDVVGIQQFSSISTLDQMQQDLETKSKDFEKQIKNTLENRSSDMATSQAELTLSIKDITKAAIDRNNTRSEFEGYRDAMQFLCCPVCGCIHEGRPDQEEEDCHRHDSIPRLKACEKQICCICADVKKTFCCETDCEPEKEDEYKEKPKHSY